PATSPPATAEPAPARTSSAPAPSASPSSVPAPSPEPKPPASSGVPPVDTKAAARAVEYAHEQLGKPYRWGGAGPDAFDCSGLTMRAWQRGGRSLPHWSVAQAQRVTRI